METTKRIVISGYYGFDNAGDEAVLYSIIQALEKQFSNTKLEITVLSNNTKKTEQTYKVKSVNRWSIKEIYKAIKQSDLLISGGGSLLQDVTSNKTVPYYLFIIKIAQLCKKEVVFYSQGYGPVNKWHNKQMVKRVLDKVEHIYVRDKDSKIRLIRAGVKSNIVVTADPVIGMEISQPIDVLSRFGFDANKIKIGISLRYWENNDKTKEKIKQVCKELEKENIEIFFIPMHYPEDKQLLEEMDFEDVKVHKVLDKLTIKETFSLIGQMDIIVSMRLHSLIMAVAQEVPVVALSYDPKVDALMDAINPDYCYNVISFDTIQVLESVLAQVTNLEKEKQNIKVKKNLLLEKVYKPARKVKKLLY